MKNAQRLAFVTAAMTVLLIGVGVLVRASGSGLGCPDWPLCHGGAVPPGHQEAWIEFSHRFVAMLVGLLVIATAVMAWRHYRHVPFIPWMATIVVPLVGFQGILGAITVVRELPPEIVATHLVTAMIILSCEFAVAWAMYLEDPDHRVAYERARERGVRLGGLAIAGLLWLGVVFWIGGYMAESGASTACEGWPLCNGSIVPGNDDQEITHMVHRYLAGGFAFLFVPLAVAGWRARREVWWAKTAVIAGSIFYVAQVVVGALNVWLTFPEPLTISHTVIAALIWSVLSCTAVLGLYRPAVEHGVQRLSGREVPA